MDKFTNQRWKNMILTGQKGAYNIVNKELDEMHISTSLLTKPLKSTTTKIRMRKLQNGKAMLSALVYCHKGNSDFLYIKSNVPE